jgi:prevent-host-death family protein
MISVGIRHLKANLSKTLRTVQKGARVEITERGQPIAILIPIGSSSDLAWAHRLVVEKKARWNGARLGDRIAKPVRLRGRGPSASEMVLEDRR